MSITPKTIVKLTNDIAKLHNQIVSSAQSCLETAIEIGGMLTEIKAELEHGEWLPWLKQLPFSESTAKRYIRVFANRETLKSVTVTDLTDAYRLLTEPKSTPPVPQSKPTKTETVSVLKDEPKPKSSPPKATPPQAKPTPKPVESKPAQQPKKKKLAEEFQDPNVVKDETGFVVPDALVPLWNRAPEIDALVVHLREVVKLAKAAQDSEDPLWAKMPQEIFSNCNLALTFLKGFRLHAVCPTCLGKQPAKCGNCGGIGIVREFFWSSCVSSEQKAMREKFIKSQS